MKLTREREPEHDALTLTPRPSAIWITQRVILEPSETFQRFRWVGAFNGGIVHIQNMLLCSSFFF